MSKRYFRLFSALLLISTLLISTTCFASTLNSNVSTEPPNEVSSEGSVTPQSIDHPTEYLNLNSVGQIDFSGAAQGSTLYLNKGFTGVTHANVTVNNYSSKRLTVKAYKDGIIDTKIYTVSVPVGMSTTFTLTNLSTSGKYYLAFEAPSNFDGYVFR